jgi:MerR family mercuric resistance operon transcriptional regulator
MKIGEAAAASGCPLETIRYYESIGLVPQPARTGNGYRRYSEDDVRRLRFVTRGRELGFNLDEIRGLLQLSTDSTLSCSEVDQLARAHLAEIEMRVAELQQMAHELRRTIASCRGGQRAACAILDALWKSTRPGEADAAVQSKQRRQLKVHDHSRN